MAFQYSVYLPGLNKTVWLKEINSRVYRELIKSLFNTDDSSFILHSNKVIEEICPGVVDRDLNIIDKLIILVNARAVCISPDLKIQVTCPATQKEFEYNVKLDTIFSTLNQIKYKNTVTYNTINVECSIVKAKDEKFFLEKEQEKLFLYQIASSIDKIKVKEKEIDFIPLSMEERITIIENLPSQIAVNVLQSLFNTEKELNKTRLLLVNSPYANVTAVDIALSTDIGILLQFCRVLFTDDLANVYKLIFSLVSQAGFSGEYIDNITPAEMYLYWSLYLQKAESENQQMNSASKNNSSFQGVDVPFS